jgi:hypothetical protein
MTKVTGLCTAMGCDRPAVSRPQYCLMHYKRWKRRGTTHDITPEGRFFSYIRPVTEWDACWIWTNRLAGGGYGQFWVGNKPDLAHRWSYEYFHAEIPDGLVLDHLCSTPPCVNPWHLEPVTQRVNLRRSQNHVGVNARKTRCIRDHVFDQANTYVSPDGRRQCRACMRMRAET